MTTESPTPNPSAFYDLQQRLDAAERITVGRIIRSMEHAR